ncbi:MerR family DNA-binding transcriptional regulator [Rhodobacteraceae bacterium HSP-20]|uniref:MerR family DNA-binding transcriptional regulator n=1 Tax=Paragemmobacter amnigenus TaxID=2852097 RepID=A0ABS6J2Q3_9RHOB|nr:MerR family DNA-binding transcriptional regulator [Rhodobacter amnigenus]MBU9698034.1 MerR family DNA-binding transcriptional regulator [Rhodobacter amnigenus]MBV4389261.1 MerR family DNA-binding transcriptional regulator [Rhodobacter amnigenus]
MTADTTNRDDHLTIRQMCDAFDVTPRTLRFYEAKELLSPLRRGTARFYTYRDRARLKLILRGKRFGFSLEDIRQLLDMYDRDGGQQEAQLRRTYDLARDRLAQMERQRAELDEAIADLKDQIAWGESVLSAFRKAAE